jgi:hypothetical protein
MAKMKFDFNDFKNKVQNENKKKKFEADERFWKPTRNDKGKGSAVIRFIPSLKCEDPFVKVFNHGFNFVHKGKKIWWIQNCPTTLEKDCLVCNKNFEYWNSPYESDKDTARERKRRTSFIANIYVIKDPGNPDNEGKVFLYQFGVKIHGMFMKHWMPDEDDLEDEDFEEFMAFDPYEGANFKMKIKPQSGFPNYDDSTFASPSEFLGGSDAKIKKVLDQAYDLTEFLAESNFPTEELTRTKLAPILGVSPSDDGDEEKPAEEKEDEKFFKPEEEEEKPKPEKKKAAPKKKAAEKVEEEPEVEADDAEDDDLAFFKNLTED